MKNNILILGLLALFSWSVAKAQNVDFNYKKIERISDSIQIQNIIIHNLFKSQILAHRSNDFDSTMIVKNVYYPHKELWDSCYAQIFGDENAAHFNTEAGIISWNKKLFDKNKNDFINRTKTITHLNLNKLIKKNLRKFSQLVPHQPSAKISILFTPRVLVLGVVLRNNLH